MKNKTSLRIALLALLLGQAAIQDRFVFPSWRKDLAPKTANVVGLSPEQILFAFAGFREFMAGVLWVRADSFFHTGNYDAILPVLRIVTWLDPHQLEVYTTGGWHLAYNFTDESQRSDRRYIQPALKFLEEGARNNDNVWDLKFELGWTYFHKIQDPVSAIPWMEEASKHPDMLEARRRVLAHAYAKAGRFQDAVNLWVELLERAEDRYKKDPDSFDARSNRDVVRNNLEGVLMRIVRRYGKYPETLPPIVLDFEATAKVVRPKTILVEGTLGILTIGARVDVILRNKGFQMQYDPSQMESFSFEVDKDLTYMQDSLAVRDGKFRREIDMSKDPRMYGFKAQEYELEISFNPRAASINVQDRIGWSGEGITDPKYLDDKTIPGVRRVVKVIPLTREEILQLRQ